MEVRSFDQPGTKARRRGRTGVSSRSAPGHVLAGVGLDYLWPIDLGFELAAAVRYGVGGAIVALSFLGLGLWSVIVFGRTGQNENPWKPTPQIVDGGPFRITRNPMYLQMLLICVGVAVMLMNVWIIVLTPVAAWTLQKFAILPEEAYFQHKFGETYLEYNRRVRRSELSIVSTKPVPETVSPKPLPVVLGGQVDGGLRNRAGRPGGGRPFHLGCHPGNSTVQ